jgi:hypothetical protein
VADFNPSVPSIARVYDYFNGGKDNFAATVNSRSILSISSRRSR